jgi:hypothetical protein
MVRWKFPQNLPSLVWVGVQGHLLDMLLHVRVLKHTVRKKKMSDLAQTATSHSFNATALAQINAP